MANNVSATEGASVLKRLKISKAQRTMFIAVCLASIALGVTFVLIIYFGKTIAFQGKLLTQKGYVVDALIEDQSNLSALSGQITRSASDCIGYYNIDMSLEGVKTDEEIEKVRKCSSLRVIPDAMPATSDKVSLDDIDTKTRIQLDLIMDWAGVDLNADSESAISVEATNYSGDYSTVDTGSILEPYSMLNANVDIKGDLAKMKTFLSTIDKTIRNFDLQRADIEIPNSSDSEFVFKGTYFAYYTNPVTLNVQKRRICADAKNKECIEAGGDESVQEGQGGMNSTSSSLDALSY